MLFDEPDHDYRYVLAHADAYKIAGRSRVCLCFDSEQQHVELPWHLVTQVEPGAFRGFAISFMFSGRDAASGIEFVWFVDIAHDEGEGYDQIDEAKVRGMLSALPSEPREQFRECLAGSAAQAQSTWRECQRITERHKRTADALHRLAADVQ